MSLSREQLLRRKSGMGASEAAAVLGQSDFGKGPLNVWASKVLPLQEEVLRLDSRIAFGNIMEPFLGPIYTKITGRPAEPVGVTKPFAGDPLVFATLDFRGTDRPVEVKNSAADQAWRWGEAGEHTTWARGLCPFDYFLQLQLQMLVEGLKVGDLAALIGGNDFRVFTFPFDEELALGIVAEMRAWWQMWVVSGEQPPADGSSDVGSILRRRFPRPTLPIEDASFLETGPLERLAEAKRLRKAAEDQEDAAAAEVMELLGEREGLRWDGGKVTWSMAAGRPRYAQLVEHLGIPKEQIQQFTSEPARQLRYWPTKERR